MRKLPLLVMLIFSSNQVFAFSTTNVDHEVDILLEQVSEMKTSETQNINDEAVKSKKKFVKVLEKELQKVESMTLEEEVKYLNEKLNKLSKKMKKLSKQLNRAAKNKSFIKKITRTSNLDRESLKAHMLTSSERYSEESLISHMKEDIDLAGGYAAYLRLKIQDIKMTKISLNKMLKKENHRTIADHSFTFFESLLMLYMMAAPGIAIAGLIVAAVGGIIMLATGGAASVVLFIGLAMVGTAVPAGIILLTI